MSNETHVRFMQHLRLCTNWSFDKYIFLHHFILLVFFFSFFFNFVLKFESELNCAGADNLMETQHANKIASLNALNKSPGFILQHVTLVQSEKLSLLDSLYSDFELLVSGDKLILQTIDNFRDTEQEIAGEKKKRKKKRLHKR